MKIIKLSEGCGGKGYGKPKGKLDTQLFPECVGTDQDRDVVKKNRKKKKKSSCEDEACSICEAKEENRKEAEG